MIPVHDYGMNTLLTFVRVGHKSVTAVTRTDVVRLLS